MHADDHIAFRKLFDEYSDRLYSYALAFVGERQAAEDIVQDTFVYLWARRGKIEFRTSAYAYLQRAVRNACVNHKVRQKIERRYFENAATLAAQGSDDLDTLDELHKQAVAFVESLPEKCREVFILGVLDGASYAEIAEKLGVTVNTVKTQMNRARKRLRTLSSGTTLLTLLFA